GQIDDSLRAVGLLDAQFPGFAEACRTGGDHGSNGQRGNLVDEGSGGNAVGVDATELGGPDRERADRFVGAESAVADSNAGAHPLEQFKRAEAGGIDQDILDDDAAAVEDGGGDAEEGGGGDVTGDVVVEGRQRDRGNECRSHVAANNGSAGV